MLDWKVGDCIYNKWRLANWWRLRWISGRI